MTQPRWREWPPDIQSVLFLTVPVIPEWSFCFPTATTRFIWSARTGRGTARYQLNGDLSFNYLYGYVASDLKLSDYPKDTRNIIPLEASDNSLGNLIELSDDKKWIVFKRNGRVRFNGCLSISWNNDFYLQVSVCRESNDSKGTPVPVVGVSIRSPLKQDNTFVYVDRVLRVKEGERLCFAFIIPNWCDTTGGFISRNSDRASSGLMANYVSFNDEMYVWNNNFIKKILQTLSLLVP